MLYKKIDNNWVLTGATFENEYYGLSENVWGQYFEPRSLEEVVQTLEFQCLSHKLTPATSEFLALDENTIGSVYLTADIPLIPKEQYLKLVKIFCHYADRSLEASAMFLYNQTTKDYKFIIPKHTSTSAGFVMVGGEESVVPCSDLEGNQTSISQEMSQGYQVVGRFHSHHSMSPTPSGVDDQDEIGRGLLFCCIVGNIEKVNNVYSWQNYTSFATPLEREAVPEYNYIESYDFHELQNQYSNGIPPLILEYLDAGLYMPVKKIKGWKKESWWDTWNKTCLSLSKESTSKSYWDDPFYWNDGFSKQDKDKTINELLDEYVLLQDECDFLKGRMNEIADLIAQHKGSVV